MQVNEFCLKPYRSSFSSTNRFAEIHVVRVSSLKVVDTVGGMLSRGFEDLLRRSHRFYTFHIPDPQKIPDKYSKDGGGIYMSVNKELGQLLIFCLFDYYFNLYSCTHIRLCTRV